jgi:hypothetical protein
LYAIHNFADFTFDFRDSRIDHAEPITIRLLAVKSIFNLLLGLSQRLHEMLFIFFFSQDSTDFTFLQHAFTIVIIIDERASNFTVIAVQNCIFQAILTEMMQTISQNDSLTWWNLQEANRTIKFQYIWNAVS